MAKPFKIKIFYLANYLYNYLFFLYKPFYFFYKTISDKEKIEFIKKNIKPGMIVLDIGANIGFYTVLLSKIVGEGGQVFAFEPDEKNYIFLRHNTKKLNNVAIFRLAVGEVSKKIRLYLSDNLNVDHQVYDIGENRKFVEVECVAIDDFLSEDKIIDFIKIDIQGYEYFALLGMKNIIERSKQMYFISEIWPFGLKKSGADTEKYLNLIKNYGINISSQLPLGCAVNQENKNYYFDIYGKK